MSCRHLFTRSFIFFFFFFQAEDGIRDRTVTGVQTCALPISGNAAFYGGEQLAQNAAFPANPAGGGGPTALVAGRSEERRVGKEWRARWAPYREKKKKRRERMENKSTECRVRQVRQIGARDDL